MRAILVACLAAASAGAATFNVRDFGAQGDGLADDYPAIRAALADARKSDGPHDIVFPAGRYLLKTGDDGGAHVHLRRAKGLTFRGEGDATVVSASLPRFFFRFEQCRDCTVRHLTLTRDRRNFTQGTITAVDAAAKTLRLAIDPGYDELDRDGLGRPERIKLFTDPGSISWGQRWDPKILDRTQVSPGQWTIRLEFIPPVDLVGIKALWWKYTGGWAFEFAECSDMLVEDVNQYPLGAGCGFGVWRCDGTITLRRFFHGIPPGSGDLVASGGVSQGADNRGTLVLEDCDFSHGDDDGVNQLSPWIHVIAKPGPAQLTVDYAVYRVGDTVSLWDWTFGHVHERAQAKVTDIKVNADRTRTLTLDHDVEIIQPGKKVGDDRNKLMRDGIDRLVDLDAVGSAVLKGCRFSSSRARPVLIKSRHALIENCTFHDAHMPGIQAGAEMYWDEGPQTLDLTVRGCTFENIDAPACDVGLFADGSDASYDGRHILIERNTFHHNGTLTTARPWMKWGYFPQGVGVRVRNATGVVIRDNTFDDNPGPNIVVQHCREVQITGNRFSHTHGIPVNVDPAEVGDTSAVMWLDDVVGATLRDNLVSAPGPLFKHLVTATASCAGLAGLTDGVKLAAP